MKERACVLPSFLMMLLPINKSERMINLCRYN
jgi:hypothetical protein